MIICIQTILKSIIEMYRMSIEKFIGIGMCGKSIAGRHEVAVGQRLSSK